MAHFNEAWYINTVLEVFSLNRSFRQALLKSQQDESMYIW